MPEATKGSTTKRATSTKRRARGSLSVDQILDGAKELVEAHGLQELGIAAVARHLDSGVTSIYWYFKSKDDLLEALTDRVSREMYRALPPIGDGPWDDELVEYFVAFRDLLVATPIYREVFAYRARFLFLRSAMGKTMLRRLEDGLSLFTRAGLSPTQAADAFNTCSNYTRGFVLLEHGMDGEDLDEAGPAPFRLLDRTELPTLSGLPDLEHLLWLDDEQFRFGLRLVVEGIRRRYDL